MNINKREKMLMGILVVVLILFGYYQFLYVPSVEKYNQLVNTEIEMDNQITKINNSTIQDRINRDKIEEVNNNIVTELKAYFPVIEEKRIVTIVDNLITESEVDCPNIGITELAMETLNINDLNRNEAQDISDLQLAAEKYKAIEEYNEEEIKNENNDKQQQKSNNLSITVPKYTVNLNLNGTYENMLNFVRNIEGYYKRIIIRSMNFAVADEDNYTAQITLDFYCIPKLEYNDERFKQWNDIIKESDNKFYIWEYNKKYGRDNPFIEYDDLSNTDNKLKNKSDFTLTVRPFSSDLPTVFIGKNDDKSKASYLSIDNIGIEEMEVYFQQQDGKYYYKYKTSEDTYPSEFDGLGKEFKPNKNDINFKVYSFPRNAEQDVSGVNVKVYNSTNKVVNIDIETDDSKRPRVNIIKSKGIIKVKRN